MKEATLLVEGKQSSTFFLGANGNELVIARVFQSGGVNLGRYMDEGLNTVGLTADQAQALCHLLGDNRESRTIERLRADHDALNARYHRLLESFGTLQKERDEVQSGFDALWEQYTRLQCDYKTFMEQYGPRPDENATRELTAVASEAASDEE